MASYRNQTSSQVILRDVVRTRLLAVVLSLLDLIGQDAGILAGAFVYMTLVPGSLTIGLELVTASAEFSDGLLCQQLLECPLLDVLLFILFELCDELDGTLEDGALVLLASGNNFG